MVQEYLKKIDEVIQQGQYKDNWQSLSKHQTPIWYQNSKFGIFIVWGIYSVPAYYDEWYPRHMYRKNSEVYNHHKEKYGDPEVFGYKDFVPMFKGENFEPKKWAKLIKESGARYAQPIAIFHDGFPMYNSDVKPFNCYNNGPQVDFLGEVKSALESEGVVFCASSHFAENYWFFNQGQKIPSDVSRGEYKFMYGPAALADEVVEEFDITKHRIRDAGPNKEFLEEWLAQSCEFVDKYHPKLVFFDWWIQNLAFKPYLKKFAAYYYNRAIEWGEEVSITYKHHAFGLDCATYDVERGQLREINPRFWQSDTSIAKNSWCFTENNDFKEAKDILCDLIDIVSKNGTLLLNIGPKADGTICEEEVKVLREIGEWMNVNSEGIYDTSYWHIYGEGPTEIPEGYFTDANTKVFTEEDIRYTYKEGYLYAFVLNPLEKEICFKNLCFPITGDELELGKMVRLGGGEVNYRRDENGLYIQGETNNGYPVCYKIELI